MSEMRRCSADQWPPVRPLNMWVWVAEEGSLRICGQRGCFGGGSGGVTSRPRVVTRERSVWYGLSFRLLQLLLLLTWFLIFPRRVCTLEVMATGDGGEGGCWWSNYSNFRHTPNSLTTPDTTSAAVEQRQPSATTTIIIIIILACGSIFMGGHGQKKLVRTEDTPEPTSQHQHKYNLRTWRHSLYTTRRVDGESMTKFATTSIDLPPVRPIQFCPVPNVCRSIEVAVVSTVRHSYRNATTPIELIVCVAVSNMMQFKEWFGTGQTDVTWTSVWYNRVGKLIEMSFELDREYLIRWEHCSWS